MQNDGSESNTGNTQITSQHCRDLPSKELDLEKQDGNDQVLSGNITPEASSTVLNNSIVLSNAESHVIHVIPVMEEPSLDSPKKGYLSRTTSSQEQCRYSFSDSCFLSLTLFSKFAFVFANCLLLDESNS